jgi:hypothetical protein
MATNQAPASLHVPLSLDGVIIPERRYIILYSDPVSLMQAVAAVSLWMKLEITISTVMTTSSDTQTSGWSQGLWDMS